MEQKEDKIWGDEASQLVYDLPLPIEAAKTGLQFAADISPKNIKHVGPFINAPSPETHYGPFRHAIDFLVVDGTPVLAASDGRVAKVVSSREGWGNGPEFRESMNYITISHVLPSGRTEYSQYCHLAKDSVPDNVKVGAVVKKGQKIGRTGKTGWTDRDHLHFLVFRSPQSGDREEITHAGHKSLVPKFSLNS